MHLPFEQFPALSAIKACRHVFVQRIPGIDLSHDKAEVLGQLDASHREIRHATGLGDWPLFTAQQVHGNKIAVLDSRFQSRFARLSPSKRGEDEGEGFRQTDPASTPTLPLSLTKGEATQEVRSRTKHSEKAGILEKCQTNFPGCDSIITNQGSIALGIYVADCCAVYVVDPKTPAIGLAHSGRKGTELGVVTNAIRQMIKRFGSHPANMVVQLSPCIRPPHYEVDFAAEIRRQCRALGVQHIHDSGTCTACDLGRYYSYRAEKGKTGRMLAVIGLDATIAN
jgi:purine-nucleoside/S-methyl-5'-thioadenosine phosphorylase / adenosine deaminase